MYVLFFTGNHCSSVGSFSSTICVDVNGSIKGTQQNSLDCTVTTLVTTSVACVHHCLVPDAVTAGWLWLCLNHTAGGIHYHADHRNQAMKVKAPFPYTRRTLVPKGLQSRWGQFIHKFFVITQDRTTRQQHWLLGCSCDQSHGSAWGTSVTHHTLYVLKEPWLLL